MKIELTEQQWKDVLALMEKGVCSLGYAAFVSGGNLMHQIVEQLSNNNIIEGNTDGSTSSIPGNG